MNLSIRLKKIADFVPDGGVMADVGTDHGHLPIYLVSLHKNTGAIAMDVRPGPLSRAEQAVRMCGLQDRIQLRLADGLAALEPGEADTVVIAGMGGALIQKILGEGRHMWDSVGHWILSPQSEIGETRHWLEEHGFSILKEDMVLDAGKYYVVMDAVRGSMHYDHEYEYAYGRSLIRNNHPVLKEFLDQEQEKFKKLRLMLENQSTERSHIRLREIEQEKNQVLAALEAMEHAGTKEEL
ncbi:MAG: class I SAM-dependent methyltransferase [Lachnospiraceae bacterium]|nr:class I SAM-dependent methyltransferase [Lachnospiraceae bacterium]